VKAIVAISGARVNIREIGSCKIGRLSQLAKYSFQWVVHIRIETIVSTCIRETKCGDGRLAVDYPMS